MRVAQICFFECPPTAIPYGLEVRKSYAGRVGVTGSQYYRMPEFQRIGKVQRQDRKWRP
jgi:hypothetical protein